jgi:beta-1,4-mannosyltransferase
MVRAADVGVCMHFSSSGLDLPMKVVDMFGAGLPCIAKHYRSIAELVKDGENGRVFKNKEDLAEQIAEVLEGFHHEQATEQLRRMRHNLQSFKDDTWQG